MVRVKVGLRCGVGLELVEPLLVVEKPQTSPDRICRSQTTGLEDAPVRLIGAKTDGLSGHGCHDTASVGRLHYETKPTKDTRDMPSRVPQARGPSC